MFRRVAYLTASAALALSLAGCALNMIGSFERRASWREAEENACMARREIMPTAFISQVKEINGRGACGIEYPLKVSAFAGGSVTVGPTAMLGCPITEAVEDWLNASVQPAALVWFGQPVIEIKQLSNYSCRGRNGKRGGQLSEHAFGNALDIAGFKLASGQVVTVRRGWRGSRDEQGFLREVAATACARFKTFLGPGAAYHADHFHVDLARHGKSGTSRYCNPRPQVRPPVRPAYGGSRVAVVPTTPSDLMSVLPPEVAAEMQDPFGVETLPKADVPMSFSE